MISESRSLTLAKPSRSVMTSILPSELGGPVVPKASRYAVVLTGLAALGIVFGDIGTSPLYTLKTAFD